MNKLLQIIAVTTVITACATHTTLKPARQVRALDTSSGTFRIGLKKGDQGPDVTTWQQFLISKKVLGLTHDNSDHDSQHGSTYATYPNGDVQNGAIFDEETEQATIRFQASFAYDDKGSAAPNGQYHLATTGITKDGVANDGVVNSATYFRAFPPAKFAISNRLAKARARHAPFTGILSNPPFNSVNVLVTMKTGCADGSGNPDVSLWQYLLYQNGYIDMYPPTGTFGTSTSAATSLFQVDAGISPTTGTVTQATYNMAHGWTNGVPLTSLVQTVSSTPKPCP